MYQYHLKHVVKRPLELFRFRENRYDACATMSIEKRLLYWYEHDDVDYESTDGVIFCCRIQCNVVFRSRRRSIVRDINSDASFYVGQCVFLEYKYRPVFYCIMIILPTTFLSNAMSPLLGLARLNSAATANRGAHYHTMKNE
jgi:hypothetical protein